MFLRTCQLLLSLLILPVCAAASPASGKPLDDLSSYSLDELERHLAAFDEELAHLARFKLLGGLSPVGFESAAHRQPEVSEWVQAEWEEPVLIDEIVLVPLIWHDPAIGFTASGFPRKFRIMAGTTPDKIGQEIAAFQSSEELLPRKAPLKIPCLSTANWVRVEASLLSERGVDPLYALQLSELLAFSGEENAALLSRVTSSTMGRQEGLRRNRTFLTDGVVPYEMDADGEKKSAFLLFNTRPEEHPTVTVDLGEPYPVNRIHLHAFNTGEQVPQALPNVFGIPDRFIIEGALKEDFSDATPLVQYQKKSLYDAGPIFMRWFSPSRQRYIRLTAFEMNNLAQLPEMMGMAEIEVFARGRNVALNRPVHVEPAESSYKEAMTDGHNAYGRILPLRRWVHELARRHDLESIRPALRAEIDHRHARQKELLRTMTWLSALLGAGIVITVLAERLVHANQIKRLRERVAADLHDELGANLYAIGVLGQVALDSTDSKEELVDTLEEISGLVARSGQATRNCINRAYMQDLDLPEDMRRAARRLGRDLEVQLTLKNEERLLQLPPPMQYNLFLFYRECLVNVSRHAEATRVETELQADNGKVLLTVHDNGSGVTGGVPNSLKRRARLLHGRVNLKPHEGPGACISLTLNIPGRFSPKRLLLSKT